MPPDVAYVLRWSVRRCRQRDHRPHQGLCPATSDMPLVHHAGPPLPGTSDRPIAMPRTSAYEVALRAAPLQTRQCALAPATVRLPRCKRPADSQGKGIRRPEGPWCAGSFPRVGGMAVSEPHRLSLPAGGDAITRHRWYAGIPALGHVIRSSHYVVGVQGHDSSDLSLTRQGIYHGKAGRASLTCDRRPELPAASSL